MTANLVCQALQMALWRRKIPKGGILHSDRGSQYCSTAYQSLVLKHQLVGSMCAKGNCYDNACAESFFHTMKVEAIHGERFATREEMSHTVFEYIEVDYNRIAAIVRMVVLALWRLKLLMQLNWMSTQYGQDQLLNMPGLLVTIGSTDQESVKIHMK